MNANDERRLTFGRLSDAIVLAIWVLLALAVIVDSQSMKEPAGRFPALSAIAIGLIAATRLGLLARGARFESDSYRLSHVRRTLLFFVGMAVLWLLVLFAGLLLGGGVWAVAALMTIYRWSLLRSLIYTVLFVAAMAVIFPALGLQLPAGILIPR